jgi:hypothetical protein
VINSRNKQSVSNANFIENEPVLEFLAKRAFHVQIPMSQNPGSTAGFLCCLRASCRLTLTELHLRMRLWRRRHEMPDHLLKFWVFGWVWFIGHSAS